MTVRYQVFAIVFDFAIGGTNFEFYTSLRLSFKTVATCVANIFQIGISPIDY